VFTDDFRAKGFPVSDSSPGKRRYRKLEVLGLGLDPIVRLCDLSGLGGAPRTGESSECKRAPSSLSYSAFDTRRSSHEKTVPGSVARPSILSPSSETMKLMSSGGPCLPLIF
jgi:hypothetical protein